jgi:signal transduction histidine kinase
MTRGLRDPDPPVVGVAGSRRRTGRLHARLGRVATALRAATWGQLESARRREYEHALREREAAEAVKQELLAVVAHEFRTPLTSIIGFAHTLSMRFDQLEPEVQRACAETIACQAKRLEWLVGNVLAASGDAVPPVRGVLDLVPLVERAVSEADTSRAARRVLLRTELPLSAPVAVDRRSAERIVTNVLDNAIKFAPPATSVRVTVVKGAESTRLETRNVAHGLRPEDVPRMFDAYVQLDSSDSRKVGGIGLGLHVVRRLTEASGGRVEASLEGEVLTIAVMLPSAVCDRQSPRMELDLDAVAVRRQA